MLKIRVGRMQRCNIGQQNGYAKINYLSMSSSLINRFFQIASIYYAESFERSLSEYLRCKLRVSYATNGWEIARREIGGQSQESVYTCISN
jgi:hypothetical protein